MAPGNATDGVAPQSPQRLLLVSVPRTASNLLMKMMNVPGRPDALSTDKGGYFFYEPYMMTTRDGLAGKPLDQWSPDRVAEVRASFQKSLDSIEEWTARARDESKILVAKEHAFWFVNPAAFEVCKGGDVPAERLATFRLDIPKAYGQEQTFSRNNHTIMSDEYLRTWRIAMIIRHPALAFPSLFRAMSKLSAVGFIKADGLQAMMLTNMTLRWTRILYDWCLEQQDVSMAPLLVDAGDVIHNPQVVVRLCEQAGLDPNAVQFDWGVTQMPKTDGNAEPEKKSDTGMDKVAASIMLSTLHSSTGIVKDKTPTAIDISVEAEKWQKEFGEEMASLIKTAVLDAMPDYEYLKERRITV